MENITLGQISNILLFIVEFVGVVTAVIVAMRKVLNKQLSPLNKKIDKLDENQCRNYLVDFLADIEKGIEKDETQIKRAYEVYDHYCKDLNLNSYIHDKWERLMNKKV